jgi:hypothetical protein
VKPQQQRHQQLVPPQQQEGLQKPNSENVWQHYDEQWRLTIVISNMSDDTAIYIYTIYKSQKTH